MVDDFTDFAGRIRLGPGKDLLGLRKRKTNKFITKHLLYVFILLISSKQSNFFIFSEHITPREPVAKAAPEKQIKVVKEAKHYTEVIDVSTFRPVANPYFCEALPSGKEYEHVWNQEACACFFQFKLGLRARCTWSHPIQNPFHEVGNYFDLCITEQEYYDIFDHPWGADCIPGTIDDPGYIDPDNHDDVDPYHIDSEEEDDDVVDEDDEEDEDIVEEEVDDEVEEEVDDEVEEED